MEKSLKEAIEIIRHLVDNERYFCASERNKAYEAARKFLEAQPALYDAEFGDERLCECGHPYRRHFDPYEGMHPVGCKYCQCGAFKEKPEL